MKLPEHVTFSFLLAQLQVAPAHGPAGTALVVAAGLLPDLDGLTVLGGWDCYRRYHRILGHGLPVTVVGPAVLAVGGAALGIGPFLELWGWLHLSLTAHLVLDVCFYRWPVQLLWPVTARGWGLGLVAWNDLVPTLVLYAATATVLLCPGWAVGAATAGQSAFWLYLAWRAWRPRSRAPWARWWTGDWAARHHRCWRWLTGDFVT